MKIYNGQHTDLRVEKSGDDMFIEQDIDRIYIDPEFLDDIITGLRAVKNGIEDVSDEGLKPCPFCGGLPFWQEFSNSFGTGSSGMEAPDIGISCCGLTLRGPTHKGNNPYLDDVTESTREKIAFKWNKRA